MAEPTMTEAPPVELTPDQEARTVEAARQDRRAFSPLYRAYVRPIYRYLYSHLGHAGDAEDLTSQVFTEALESLPRYHHRGHFLAWLFSIARHRLLNFQHRRRPEADIEIAEYFECYFFQLPAIYTMRADKCLEDGHIESRAVEHPLCKRIRSTGMISKWKP